VEAAGIEPVKGSSVDVDAAALAELRVLGEILDRRGRSSGGLEAAIETPKRKLKAVHAHG
jgi:hypothetical protein